MRGRRVEGKARKYGKSGIRIYHVELQNSYDECAHYVYLKCISKFPKKELGVECSCEVFITELGWHF